MAHLFCLGDSITDCQRLWDNPPLGCGYVQLLNQRFQNEHSPKHPNTEVSVINCGTDGFTLSRLLSKVSAPAFSAQIKKEDVITLLIGINDIGLMQNTCRTDTQKQKMMETFMHNYDILITLLQSRSPRLILLEPFIFPYPQEFSLWLPYVHAMSASINELSRKHRIPFVFLHDALNEAAAFEGFSHLTTDGIHLTLKGHQIISDRLFPLVSSFFP